MVTKQMKYVESIAEALYYESERYHSDSKPWKEIPILEKSDFRDKAQKICESCGDYPEPECLQGKNLYTLGQNLYTLGQVAKMFAVGPRTATKWFDTGILKGYRIPGSQDRRVPAKSIIAFIKNEGLAEAFPEVLEFLTMIHNDNPMPGKPR